jgi:hypothetical protein
MANQQIINPNFNSKEYSFINGKNMIRCNKNSDVYKFIRTGRKYVIEIPDTQTILNVECAYAAILAADMKVISAFVNGNQDHSIEGFAFSYSYENFDSINYTSFAYSEKCIVYISMDDL